MITQEQFMQVLQDWAPGPYTMDSTMAEYEQSDTSDEYGEIFSEMTEQVLGIDALDYDEHPVLEAAWNDMYPHKWKTLRDFYNYVLKAFTKHVARSQKRVTPSTPAVAPPTSPVRKKKLVLPELNDAASWDELVKSDQKDAVTTAYINSSKIPKITYQSVMDPRIQLTVTWLENLFHRGFKSDAILLVQSPTHTDLSLHYVTRAMELIEWFKTHHVNPKK